jgi:hypothetical protein
MIIAPIMVTTSSSGLKTIATIGIRNIAGDDDIADYEVTVDGVLRANVNNFERARGATALVREALEAIELNRPNNGDTNHDHNARPTPR